MSANTAQKDFMRGLHNFITDVHNAKSKDEETKLVNRELAKIRQYYKEEKNPDWYQRRKYVTKLLYIHLLGYTLDFGHMPAIQLIGATKYHEKQTGYLAAQLLMSENHELAPLLVNSIQEDLVTSRSDAVRSLALSAIANIGGKEVTETLSPLVLKLLLSSASAPLIKKKAALAYLRLLRKNRDIGQNDPQLPEKLVALLEDRDLGVINAVITLVNDCARAEPERYKAATPRVIYILSKVAARHYGREYMYHNVPHPWLQIRCLQFLRLVPPTDKSAAASLAECLARIVSQDLSHFSSENNKNATYAILFQAIALIFQVGADEKLLAKAVAQLSRFILSKDTNLRYLALEAFAQLAETENAQYVRKHQKTVFDALKEVDISVRRRALDLLYRMCDAESAPSIIDSLLDYLAEANIAIKEEAVLKIAILAERFLTGTEHYVDVIVRLVTAAGEYVSDEIWFRLVKVVVNCEAIQAYAARAVFDALQHEPCHETMVKIAGFVLGEYGHLIAAEPGCAPADQARVLHARFRHVSDATKALLLSTYAKFVNLFPELTDQLRAVFKDHLDNIDVEVQQRACEYYHITVPGDRAQELMQTVLDALPPWEEVSDAGNGSAAGAADAADAGATSTEGAPQGQQSQGGAQTSIMDLLGDFAPQTTQSGTTRTTTVVNPALSEMGYTADMKAPSSMLDVLQSNSFASATPATMAPSAGAGAAGAGASAATATLDPEAPAEPTTVVTELTGDMNAKVRAQWMRLSALSDGVLYSDGTMQIGVKSEFHGNAGRVVLFFGNLTPTPIVGLALALHAIPQLQLQTQALAQTVIGPVTQVQHVVLVRCEEEFKDIMLMHVEWIHPATSTKVSIDLPFPVMLTKFLAAPPASALAAPEFIAGWKALSAPGMEQQQVFRAGSPINVAAVRKFLVDAYHTALVDGIDSRDTNLVGVAALAVGTRQIPVLLRLETNAEAQMFRITLRTQSPVATNTLASFIMSQLSAL